MPVKQIGRHVSLVTVKSLLQASLARCVGFNKSPNLSHATCTQEECSSKYYITLRTYEKYFHSCQFAMCNFVERRGQTGDYLKSGIGVYGTILKKLLPVGLLAQLVKCCTGIVEVKGSNPVQTWIFSGFLFETAKVVSITAMIFFHIINSQKLQRMPHCRVPTMEGCYDVWVGITL